jgi:hypothetical protein
MARELSEVLHYFLDDAPARPAPRALAVPIEEKDVVRVAFAWNLAVELARGGARTALVAPEGAAAAAARDALGEAAGGGVLAPELRYVGARGPAELGREVAALAPRPGGPGSAAALPVVLVPSAWLARGAEGEGLFRWTLLFAAASAADLASAYATAARVYAAEPEARVGVTIHGVASVAEARAAFGRLAARVQEDFGRELWSYGLLLDELLVYRTAAERRPVGLSHPQSLAARAMLDVARLLVEDAGGGAPGAAAA